MVSNVESRRWKEEPVKIAKVFPPEDVRFYRYGRPLKPPYMHVNLGTRRAQFTRILAKLTDDRPPVYINIIPFS
jgi:hypothetical protein